MRRRARLYAGRVNLEDVYWTRKGRQSIDEVMLFGSLLLIGVHGWSFLGALARDARWWGGN